MALILSDPDSGVSLPLYTGQAVTDERDAALDVSPPIGHDAGAAFLTALEHGGRSTVQGVATGTRIAEDGDFASDETTALAEWVAQFEALVNGAQGRGYDFERPYRGDSIRGLIDTLQWTARGGEALEVGWSLSVQQGEGVDVQRNPVADSVSPGGDWTVDGVTLEGIREFTVEKSQELSVARRAFADDPSDNDILSESGATKRISMTGQVAKEWSGRTAFDDSLRSSLGQDTLITVREAMTGRSTEGMLATFDATDESGTSRLGEFGVEVVKGGK